MSKHKQRNRTTLEQRRERLLEYTPAEIAAMMRRPRRKTRIPGTLFIARILRERFHSTGVNETRFRSPAMPGKHFYPARTIWISYMRRADKLKDDAK